MTKRSNFDFLLMQPRSVEAERQAARREAFQQMAQTLQNKHLSSSNQVTESSTTPKNDLKNKTTVC